MSYYAAKQALTLAKLRQQEWSQDFEDLMHVRLLTGYYRYGSVKDAHKKIAGRVGSIRKRLAKYLDTGNTEYLVDVANLCMVEFIAREAIAAGSCQATDHDDELTVQQEEITHAQDQG